MAFRYIGVILLTTALVFGHESRLVSSSRRTPGSFLRVEAGDTRETIKVDGLIERLRVRSEGLQTPVFLTKQSQLKREGERNLLEPKRAKTKVDEEQYIWI